MRRFAFGLLLAAFSLSSVAPSFAADAPAAASSMAPTPVTGPATTPAASTQAAPSAATANAAPAMNTSPAPAAATTPTETVPAATPAETSAPAPTAQAAPAPQSQAGGINMPIRGMNMANVEHIFGTPVQKYDAVGKPPITRWDYPDYVVYFEYNMVLHTVMK